MDKSKSWEMPCESILEVSLPNDETRDLDFNITVYPPVSTNDNSDFWPDIFRDRWSFSLSSNKSTLRQLKRAVAWMEKQIL